MPSDQWAVKKEMDKFVPQLNAVARASPDGHDPASQTSAARAGTASSRSGEGEMSRFFTGDDDDDDESSDPPDEMYN